MPDFMRFVSAMREQMDANLSRSDILRPLAWLIGILIFGMGVALYRQAPGWVLVSLVAFLATVLIVYITAYLFCLFNDRDALRSEKYSLHKFALEHGLYGDNTTGLISPAVESPNKRAETIDQQTVIALTAPENE